MIDQSVDLATQVTNIMVWVNLILIIFQAIGFGLLYHKLSTLTQLIMILQSPKTVDALHPDELYSKYSDGSGIEIKLPILLQLIMLACLTLWITVTLTQVAIYLLEKANDFRSNWFYVRSPQGQTQVELVIHISTGQHFIDLIAQTLFVDPSRLKLQLNPAIIPTLEFQQSSKFNSHVIVNWNGFVLYHSDTKQVFPLASVVPVPYLATKNLNAIMLADLIYIEIMLGSNKLFKPLFNFNQVKEKVQIHETDTSDATGGTQTLPPGANLGSVDMSSVTT